MNITCAQCISGSNYYYDICNDESVISFFIMGILYMIFLISLTIYIIIKICKDATLKFFCFTISFYGFVDIGLLIRAFYFVGGIRPFCYSRIFYNITADYPCLFQSMSMIVLIYYSSKFMELLQVEYISFYIYCRRIGIFIIIIYSLAFVSIHLFINLYNYSIDHLYYLTSLLGQLFILIILVLIIWNFAGQLEEIHSRKTSINLRIYLIPLAILLLLRATLALLNMLNVINYLRIQDTFYVYIIIMMIAFEIIPVVLLTILFMTEMKETKNIMEKIDSFIRTIEN